MTPQIGKRKDGLCPSLHYHQSAARQVVERPGELSKVYQTNSALLLQIKKKDNIPKEVMELQSLVEAIYATLKNAVKHREGVTDLRFKPEGCIWIVELADEIASAQFRIEIILEAQEGMGMTIYYIDSRLIPKIEIDPNPLAPSPSGFNVAKEVYDKITLFVRKSIVRYEFPEFPEGCKGRPFREVYQLNARVSRYHKLKCGRRIDFQKVQRAHERVRLTHLSRFYLPTTAQSGFVCDRMSRDASSNRIQGGHQMYIAQRFAHIR